MGTHYRLIILDEFDWNYVNYSRDKFVKEFLEIMDKNCLEASLDGMVIVDLGKTSPWNEKVKLALKKLPNDNVYYQSDHLAELKIWRCND